MHSKMNLMIIIICFLAAVASAVTKSSANRHTKSSANFHTKSSTSSVVFPVTGNVYPKGYYHATVNIGNPPKPYFLDIDTGSDLTWLQCDVPCVKCLPAPHKLYKPNKDLVACMDPLCASVHWPETHDCKSSQDQCDYEVQYADHGSSLGLLVKDWFLLQYINGSVAKPRLAFGCGYNQEVLASMDPPYTDGILGLGVGKASILRQLHELGVTKNVVGHCLSAQGDGYLFFGDELVPSSRVVWTPMSTTEVEKHYSLRTAELYYGGKKSGVKGLPIVFDSGSTYTYLNAKAYKALLSMLMNDGKGKYLTIANDDESLPVCCKALLSTLMNDVKGEYLTIANDDKSLPVCWKGSKPFKSIQDVKHHFKPIMLRFANSKNARLQFDPEAYLIISKHGNACLGILDGSKVGLENVNLIGDISMLDKIIIYDNENKRIGWAPANCNKLPRSEGDGDLRPLFIDSVGDGDSDYGGLFRTYGSSMGVFQDYWADIEL